VSLRQRTHELVIPTNGRGFYEFTGVIAAWVLDNEFQTGLLTIFIRHTSASLLIQENADPEVRRDSNASSPGSRRMATRSSVTLARAMTTGPRTIRTALTSVQISIPVHAGSWRSAPGRASICGNTAPRPSSARGAHFIGE